MIQNHNLKKYSSMSIFPIVILCAAFFKWKILWILLKLFEENGLESIPFLFRKRKRCYKPPRIRCRFTFALKEGYDRRASVSGTPRPATWNWPTPPGRFTLPVLASPCTPETKPAPGASDRDWPAPSPSPSRSSPYNRRIFCRFSPSTRPTLERSSPIRSTVLGLRSACMCSLVMRCKGQRRTKRFALHTDTRFVQRGFSFF